MDRCAWVTLATNDAYSLGALVLAHSLRRVGTKYEVVCMITPGVTTPMREKLATVFSLVQEVNVLDSKDEANLALLARPELGITFTKLHCWRLTQYEKCVFVDADALVVRNCDELFEREELSAAPDVGWPDCFNSGVFVFKPSQQTFASITAFAAAKGSFDGGDQGLLNMYFSDWATKDISKHLPFIYNMCSTATYSYLPAFKQFGEDVRIIHFIGITKPWLQYFDTLTGIVQPPPGSAHLQPLLQLWWNIFCEQVHHQLSASMTGIVGALAQMTLGAARSEQQIALEDHMRKQGWEQGQIDYMGRDSFDNIWKKICETLSKAAQRASPPKEDKSNEESTAAVESAAAQPTTQVDASAVGTAENSTQVQSLAHKVSKEKLPVQTILEIGDGNVVQSSEQKAPALLTEGSFMVEMSAMKASSEPVQSLTENVCAEPKGQKLQNTESCESSAEVLSPISPVVSPLEECKLASPMTQEVASKNMSQSAQLLSQESPQAESQTSACLLADLICKPPTQDAVAPIQDVSTLIEDKSQISIPVSAVVTQPTVTSVEHAADVKQPLTIDPSERHADMLLAASEISTMSPVPIQVAESVLQAEPKESVSGAAPTASDQAIATTVTAVHEPSTDVTPSAITTEERVVQLNGSVCDVQKRRNDIVTVASSLPEKFDEDPPAPTKELASVMTKETSPEMQPTSVVKIAEQVVTTASTAQVAKTEAKLSEQAEVAKADTTKGTSPEQAAKIEVKKIESAEHIEQATRVEVAQATTTAKPQSDVSQSLVAEKPQEPSTKPVEMKALNIPSTPTVMEATPPVSPSVESAQEMENVQEVESAQEVESQEKATKKSLKKSDSTDGTDGEGADKKAGKKTVKKVTKKSKPSKSEEAASTTEATVVAGAAATIATTATATATAAGDNSQNKSKKTVKVAKKAGAKSGQSLETDTMVPETPPPPVTSDVPVPPKRKTKNAAKSSTDKKPEAEE